MRMQKLFDGTLIDFDEVVLVRACSGDVDWLRYIVRFRHGHEVEIYETRQYAEDKALPQFPREKLISLLGKESSYLELFQDQDTGFMVLAALRYCHGRMTYAPSLMVEWVKKYWEQLGDNTQELIRKETREYMQSTFSKGMKCDRLTWEDFAQWIEEN
jgi:hypothetical protein